MSANRMPGVTGSNTSNVSGPSGMDVINNNSTSTGKVGDSQKTGMSPAKMDTSAAGKSGGLSIEKTKKLAMEAMTNILNTLIAAVGAAPASGKGDVAGKGDAASKDDAASKAGDDPAKTDEAAEDKSESSKFELAKETMAKLVDAFKVAVGMSPADGKGDVASAKGKGAEADGKGDKGAAGKDDVAKAAETAIKQIETIASKKSKSADDSKSIFAANKTADKQPMGVFEADVAKTAMNAIRDVANKPANKSTDAEQVA